MADDDIRELYLIPVERRADCLVCADDTLPLLTMILGDTVTLCSRHLVELTRRADAADGSHLSVVGEPER